MVYQKLSEAAHAVAAHLGKSAIRIDVMHVASAFWTFRGTNQNNAVAADAKMPIAKESYLFSGELNRLVEIVDKNEVVPKTMQFSEIQFHGMLLLSVE